MAVRSGSMKGISINGVKMYSITSQQTSVPTWIPPKKQRALRKDKNYQQRVELIQDLRFETSTSKIKVTPDGEYVIASGIYPPQVKVYELRDLSMKFERHLDAEIIDFQILDDDYSKLAFLCTDRSVNLHAKYGKHYVLRIPRMGRDMAYDCWSCDLLCAASSPDLYRINLEQGRFLSSLNTRSPALNTVSRSKHHGLVACGGEDGFVECFDTRMRSAVGRINAVAPTGDIDQEVTAVEFDEDGGFIMAVGSSTGKVLLYDLRSSNPIRIKDHMYGSPILDIKWHRSLNSEQEKLITTDSHVVRIWDPETGDGLTSIEPTAGSINDICVFSNSGLMFLALDCGQIPSYFVPSLGPAPKWCPTLENLTEEMEEDAEATIYDNFKFLTRDDLEKLNLTNLIGTNLLRASMHGFFIDHRLYKKAKAQADPFAYDKYIEQRKREKQEKDVTTRITIRRKLPKVNRKLAGDILENEETENEKKEIDENDTKKPSKKKKGISSELFEDNRFNSLFQNEEFEIDEQSREYLSLHPMASTKQASSLVNEHFEAIDDDQDSSDSDASSSEDDEPGNMNKKSRGPRLYEVKDGRHAEAFSNSVSLRKEESLPIGERVAALGVHRKPYGPSKNIKFGPGGSREISFISRSKSKYKEDEEDNESQGGKKRGVQSLGLTSGNSGGFRGRGRGNRGGGRGRGGGGRGRGRGRR
ncbi:Nucleolar protein 10 [Euphorbia peplus]|nr:Nucleolar protein 10 [Euphorbia peplus]